MVAFETARLRARPMTSDDLEDLCRLHADARVMATLGGPRSRKNTAAALDADIAHWQRHGFGFWAIRDKASDAFAGRGGLRHTAIAEQPEIELAYAYTAESWGRGLATCVRHAFETFGLDNLACITLTTNAASRRVMEKAGFRFERDILHAGLPHILCRLERPRTGT